MWTMKCVPAAGLVERVWVFVGSRPRRTVVMLTGVQSSDAGLPAVIIVAVGSPSTETLGCPMAAVISENGPGSAVSAPASNWTK